MMLWFYHGSKIMRNMIDMNSSDRTDEVQLLYFIMDHNLLIMQRNDVLINVAYGLQWTSNLLVHLSG